MNKVKAIIKACREVVKDRDPPLLCVNDIKRILTKQLGERCICFSPSCNKCYPRRNPEKDCICIQGMPDTNCVIHGEPAPPEDNTAQEEECELYEIFKHDGRVTITQPENEYQCGGTGHVVCWDTICPFCNADNAQPESVTCPNCKDFYERGKAIGRNMTAQLESEDRKEIAREVFSDFLDLNFVDEWQDMEDKWLDYLGLNAQERDKYPRPTPLPYDVIAPPPKNKAQQESNKEIAKRMLNELYTKRKDPQEKAWIATIMDWLDKEN